MPLIMVTSAIIHEHERNVGLYRCNWHKCAVTDRLSLRSVAEDSWASIHHVEIVIVLHYTRLIYTNTAVMAGCYPS